MKRKKLSREAIEKQISKHYQSINNLREEVETRFDAPKMKSLVGKFYKYHNSYGRDERWWLYIKVVGVNGIMLDTIEFQKTSMKEFIVKDSYKTRSVDSNYIEITETEYYKALEDFRGEILEKLDSGREILRVLGR